MNPYSDCPLQVWELIDSDWKKVWTMGLEGWAFGADYGIAHWWTVC